MPSMAGRVATMPRITGVPQGGPAVRDLNDVKYDAFLANYRTLADPETVKVEPGGKVLLRVINSSSMSNYHLDLGQLKGELIAFDGSRIAPARRAPLPDCGSAAARHPCCRPPRDGSLSGARRTRRRTAP